MRFYVHIYFKDLWYWCNINKGLHHPITHCNYIEIKITVVLPIGNLSLHETSLTQKEHFDTEIKSPQN